MGLLDLFSSSKSQAAHPDLFEKELVQIELKIKDHQERLESINDRSRSTIKSISTHSTLTWLIYSILWYLGWSPLSLWFDSTKNQNRNGAQPTQSKSPIASWNFTLNQSIQILPILLIPIGLISLRWLLQTWFQRQKQSEQLQLRLLQKKLRDKVEEIKKKTAYYSTKELLERYDDKPLHRPSHKSPQNQNQAARMGFQSMTPPNPEALRQRHPPSSSTPTNELSSRSTIAANPSSAVPVQSSAPPSASQTSQPQAQQFATPSPSSGRGWADRFAEALLGDDEARPESKYALICIKCYSHNGLVRKEELDQIQYLCPKCGTFNPSRNRRPNKNLRSVNGGEEVVGHLIKEGKEVEAEERFSDGRSNRVRPPQSEGGTITGRKSLGGPVINIRRSFDDPSFNVNNNKKRAASFAAVPPIPSIYRDPSPSLPSQPDTNQADRDDQASSDDDGADDYPAEKVTGPFDQDLADSDHSPSIMPDLATSPDQKINQIKGSHAQKSKKPKTNHSKSKKR